MEGEVSSPLGLDWGGDWSWYVGGVAADEVAGGRVVTHYYHLKEEGVPCHPYHHHHHSLKRH